MAPQCIYFMYLFVFCSAHSSTISVFFHWQPLAGLVHEEYQSRMPRKNMFFKRENLGKQVFEEKGYNPSTDLQKSLKKMYKALPVWHLILSLSLTHTICYTCLCISLHLCRATCIIIFFLHFWPIGYSQSGAHVLVHAPLIRCLSKASSSIYHTDSNYWIHYPRED